MKEEYEIFKMLLNYIEYAESRIEENKSDKGCEIISLINPLQGRLRELINELAENN